MSSISLIQIVTGLTAVISFIIGTSVLYHGAKRKFSPSLFLGFFFYCFTAMTALDFLVSLLTISEEELARVLMNLSTIAMIVSVLFFLLYTDRITGVTLALSPKTAIGLFLCGITLGIAIEEPWEQLHVGTGSTGWVQLWQDNFTIIFLFVLLFAFGNFLLTLWSAYKEIENPRQRLIVFSVFWGLVIAVGGGAVLVVLEDLALAGLLIPRLEIYVLFLGTIILGIAQLLEPLALYFIPARIDVCGIANDSGVPYVSYVPVGGAFDTSLGTAAITGVQALIKEVANAEKGIKSLDSGDKKILFEYYQAKEGSSRVIAFLISSVETISLHDALSHVLTTFIKQYEKDLDLVVDVDYFMPFQEEIKQILSFAISKKESLIPPELS
ncbi:MAG: hypothetical protein ACFFBD_01250 [Candidatus Hodarchaeota archaeon]